MLMIAESELKRAEIFSPLAFWSRQMSGNEIPQKCLFFAEAFVDIRLDILSVWAL